MRVSRIALAAAFALAGPAFLYTVPAESQGIRGAEKQREELRRRGKQEQPAPQQAQVAQLTAEENAAIGPLMRAFQAQDWAAATAAIPAAQAGAQSPYAKYVVGELQFQIGRSTQNDLLQSQGVDAMLASGAAPPENLRPLLGNQAAFAIRANNYAAAEAPLTRLVELDPNDLARINQLTEVKIRLNKRPEALALLQRALQLSSANGQTPPEPLFRRALTVAYEGRLAQPTLEIVRNWLTAYPTPSNWRDAMLIYRQMTQVDAPTSLDVSRFMRAAQLLSNADEYLALAEELNRSGLPGEVKAVLDEGISRGVLQSGNADVRQLMALANARLAEDRAGLAALRTQALAGSAGRLARSTADAYFGYGQYAEAAELYRAALQKGGEDPSLVNTRLGMALALAGQRAEAEAAFRAVTGPRSELANYWLLWLARRAG